MNLFKNIHKSWVPLLHSLAYEEPLLSFLENLRETSYQPHYSKIFKVFETPLEDIKVVILGSDPYSTPDSATGVAYAVPERVEVPVMLKNIKGEIFSSKVEINDNFQKRSYNSLNHLTEQGVFLLNSALTVETANAGSHLIFWKKFTEKVVSFISEQTPCVWMLWGRQALSFRQRIINSFLVVGYDRELIDQIPIDPKLNYIIPGEHPIVLSINSKGFSNDGFYKVNKILEKKSLKKIIW